MKPSFKRGFTLVEVMIVVAIIALLAAIAIPNVLRGRTSANETAAIGNLRALVSSLEMFRSVNNGFPLTAAWVADMYTTPDPDFGPPSFNVAMTGQTIQGFNWTYTAATANNYSLLAVPAVLGTTGSRSFFTAGDGIIRHCRGTGTVANMVNDSTIDVAPLACG
jgi:prepilin-type N-terminal cleavage/methylation domain-containing protein